MGNRSVIVQAFTEMAPRYERTVDGELQKFWGWSYDGFVENLMDLTPLREEDAVLDVATGTSVIPLKIVGRGRHTGRIVGLDITLAMLRKGQQKIEARSQPAPISLTCASAMSMPYGNGSFDVVLCGLATHHLDVAVLLAEMGRVLKKDGRLTIADVGGSPAWRLPVIKPLIRTAAFLYFLPGEGFARARSEAGALSNVYTGEEWKEKLRETHFEEIQITELPTSHSWSPSPLVIRAKKAASR